MTLRRLKLAVLALALQGSFVQADPALLEEAYNVAYYGDDAAAMQALLQRGFPVDARHGQDNTMLMYAVSRGLLAVAKVLVDAGADVEARSEVGHTALRTAVWTGDKPVEAVKFLIAAGADVNAAGADGWTPLVQAMYDMDGDAEAMGRLLLAGGADARVVYNDGNSALHVAVSRGHVSLIPLLLAAGADGNALGGDGESPLFMAVDEDRPEIAKALLEGGVVADIGDDDGKTPLIHASMRGRTAMVELLLAHCARTDLRDDFFGKTAAELAPSSDVRSTLAAGSPASCRAAAR